MLSTVIDIERRHPGKYCCEPKSDGWRRPLYLPKGSGGIWTPYSKYNVATPGKGAEAKMMPPTGLMKELQSLGFPEGTAFDAEWMGPRCVKDTGGQHWFIIYDILYLDEQWQGDLPYRERKSMMTTIVNLHKAKAKAAGIDSSHILITDYVEEGFRECYEDQKPENNAGCELSEGIVVKRWDSKLVGGGDNPNWMKVRYRA